MSNVEVKRVSENAEDLSRQRQSSFTYPLVQIFVSPAIANMATQRIKSNEKTQLDRDDGTSETKSNITPAVPPYVYIHDLRSYTTSTEL